MARPQSFTKLIKHHEFWHPRLYEFPFYIYLALQCLFNKVSVRGLAKANYALDHGEIGIGSKYQTQMRFPQERFLPTALLDLQTPVAERQAQLHQFVELHGLPVILKPNIGMVGKGIRKIESMPQAINEVKSAACDYLLQQYCSLPREYGVFYIRSNDQSRITGINEKHFPVVTGDGKSTIGELAQRHERYSAHWAAILRYHDLGRVPAAGERLQLSFIGSHTLGCMFSDASELLTAELEREIFSVCDAQPGFNFGRLDVRAASDAAFRSGEFTVIEVNGVSSLPTHMFDPGKTLRESYRIFFEHGRYLASIAAQHRARPMQLLPSFALLRKVIASQRELEKLHQGVKQAAFNVGEAGLN